MTAGDCKESFMGLPRKNVFFLGLPHPLFWGSPHQRLALAEQAALPQHLETWLENGVPVAAIVWTGPKGPGLASLSGPHLVSHYAQGYY